MFFSQNREFNHSPTLLKKELEDESLDHGNKTDKNYIV